MKQCIEQVNRAVDWRFLPTVAAWVIEQSIAIQQIPAPTFQERTRAEYVAEQFKALGLAQVDIDEVGNVYGLLAGTHGGSPAIMISAHTDTIFSQETDLTIRTTDTLIYGPGLGDNSIGVGGMLGLASALQRESLKPDCDLWFVATTREEGLGDLGGMKAAYERLKTRIGSVINLEGLAFGHIYHAGIAVRRLHITLTAAGGHSWLHFGRASAIHSLMELGAKITALRPAQVPRTTYNIGMIDGGQAINAIASQASMWLDMRSEDPKALATLEQQVRALIQNATSDEIQIAIEVVGDRPAGYLTPEHPLVQGAITALAQLNVRANLETGSTDANVPLAHNCPAVTIGITRGGNAHRLDEYVETGYVASGLRQLVTLTLAAAIHQHQQHNVPLT